MEQKLVSQLYHENPLPPVSLTAFILGVVGGASIPLIYIVPFSPLPVYIFFVCVFHFLEYYITARYQSDKVSLDSFLINNGATYHVAHLIALLETLTELYFFPHFKQRLTLIKLAGLCLVVIGQLLRSAAMVYCGESFSHLIATEKKSNHVLVTSGIYSLVRHPSYVGFFYWALGTQLLLLNPITFIVFLALLYQFFSQRIQFEESKLSIFFGKDYTLYKQRVPAGIPFL